MPQQITKYKVCIVDGCGRASHGKAYCGTHLKGRSTSAPITAAVLSSMRSMCCDATCTTGDPHEYGKQYCEKCGSACMWRPVSKL